MLDEIMAIYDIHEVHEVVVHATIPQVWAALHQVALQDVPVFHALMAARELPGRLAGRPWLTAEPRRPLLEHMGSSGFVQLAERAPVETVLGLLARPWRLGGGQARVRDAASFLAFDEPGWSKAVMGFRLDDVGDAVRLRTETRIRSTDATARRNFRAYWAVAGWGSAATRRAWLKAAKTMRSRRAAMRRWG